jgi:hypothetical protein
MDILSFFALTYHGRTDLENYPFFAGRAQQPLLNVGAERPGRRTASASDNRA